MKALLRWLLDLLYPPKCMLCHKLLESSDAPTCGRCEYDLPEFEQAPVSVPFCASVIAPFHYEGCVRASVLRFKFHGMQTYAGQYARWMAARLVAERANHWDLISWVPCSGRRKWTRGFDQAELLARALSRELQIPCEGTLKKIRHTKKQSSISSPARRRANVLGAYEVLEPARIAGRKILLVDDVCTTGATLSECGKTLQLAGAEAPDCAVVAAARRKTEKQVDVHV